MMSDWVVEPREVPAELTDDFEHETFPLKPVHFDSVADKIDHATLAQLRELARGGIGEPDAGH